ncbi:MAG: enoyl-CoA hydratase family protein [Actinomycetota bacterium]|nr:enoyl-CoA hydratase family protein [Actinomycetota bacterium]
MAVSSERAADGVVVVTLDYPPVNALPVRGWFDLADALRAAGEDRSTRVVLLRAEGRGFCAGIDIKEAQADDGYDTLIGANHGCYAAFSAVYHCPVPVVAAVHGFCLGGGVGVVGNADIVVAADDATFAVPEVDRGALGAATHLARLVPQHLMRTLYYTGRSIGAEQVRAHGGVYDVVSRSDLDEVALDLAREIAAKDGTVLRCAKQALNGIDPVDVDRSYRFEQGFTFELNLAGVSDSARQRFLDRRGTDRQSTG